MDKSIKNEYRFAKLRRSINEDIKMGVCLTNNNKIKYVGRIGESIVAGDTFEDLIDQLELLIKSNYLP